MSQVLHYCIDSRELNYIVFRCLKTHRMWYQMNSYLATINVVHKQEIETGHYNVVTGKRSNGWFERIEKPSLKEMILPIIRPNDIIIEGEYLEWEYYKHVYNRIRRKRKHDEELTDDYLFYSGVILKNIISRAYGYWFCAGTALKEFPVFFPELQYLFIPFINDFPDLKAALPDELDNEDYFDFDPAQTITYIPPYHISTLKKEIEKRRPSLIKNLLKTGWQTKWETVNIALPFITEILDFSKENGRGVLMVRE